MLLFYMLLLQLSIKSISLHQPVLVIGKWIWYWGIHFLHFLSIVLTAILSFDPVTERIAFFIHSTNCNPLIWPSYSGKKVISVKYGKFKFTRNACGTHILEWSARWCQIISHIILLISFLRNIFLRI